MDKIKQTVFRRRVPFIYNTCLPPLPHLCLPRTCLMVLQNLLDKVPPLWPRSQCTPGGVNTPSSSPLQLPSLAGFRGPVSLPALSLDDEQGKGLILLHGFHAPSTGPGTEEAQGGLAKWNKTAPRLHVPRWPGFSLRLLIRLKQGSRRCAVPRSKLASMQVDFTDPQEQRLGSRLEGGSEFS